MLSRPVIAKARQPVWWSSRVEALKAPFLYHFKVAGILSIIMAIQQLIGADGGKGRRRISELLLPHLWLRQRVHSHRSAHPVVHQEV